MQLVSYFVPLSTNMDGLQREHKYTKGAKEEEEEEAVADGGAGRRKPTRATPSLLLPPSWRVVQRRRTQPRCVV